MKKIAVFLLFFAVFLSSAAPALAANLGFEENYILPPSKTFQGNAYVAASTAIIAGQVSEDLTIGAGDISLSGAIGKEVLALGGNIETVAVVGEDFRAAGGRITVTRIIGNDLVLAGGYLNILPEAKILGDAYLFGWRISLLGDYGKNVYLAGSDITIDGTIAGNVKIFSAGNINIGEHAVINGNLTYSSDKDANISKGAIIKGNIIHEYSAPAVTASSIKGFVRGLVGVAFLVRLLMTLAAALFFVMVFRRMSVVMVKKSVAEFWRMVLVGLVVAVAIPIASVLLIITILGSLIGMAAMVLYGMLALLALIYSGVVFGSWCMKYLFKKELPPVLDWKMVVLGVLVFHILSLVPIVGVLVALIFFLNAFGSVSNLAYQQFIKGRK